MLSVGPWQRRRTSSPALNRGSAEPSEHAVLHTKNIVEPGRYSHRSTALPLSDLELKSGFAMRMLFCGPVPSASTIAYAGVAPASHPTPRPLSSKHWMVDPAVLP